VNLVPIVLGEGLPFFDGIERSVELDGPEVIQGTGVTHLRYRVARAADGSAASTEATAVGVAQPGRR
jgi:hypothetical protein